MTTVSINRSTPPNQPLSPITLHVESVTPFEVVVPLVSLLSGPLDDYAIQQGLPNATGPVWNIVAKSSYQDRFREKQLAVTALEERMKMQETAMEEMSKKLSHMQKRENCREICMTTMEVYTRLGRCMLITPLFCTLLILVLRSAAETLVWTVTTERQKPVIHLSNNESYVYEFCHHLISNFLMAVPRLLTEWWITQNLIDPVAYPLPQSLRQHGPPTSNDDEDWEDRFIENHGQETPLGVAVRRAWEIISPVDRELMLFCWVARQDYQEDRLDFAHPKPALNTAFEMVEHDLSGNLQVLALTLILQSPDNFAA